MRDTQLYNYWNGSANPGARLRERLREHGYYQDSETIVESEDNVPLAALDPDVEIPMLLSMVRAPDPKAQLKTTGARLSVSLYFSEHTFAVVAHGEDMTREGIREGDLLIIDRDRVPIEGQVVLVRQDGKLSVELMKSALSSESIIGVVLSSMLMF